MNTAIPIKDKEQRRDFQNYYKEEKPNYRNYFLIKIGLYSAFRISDILKLKWGDIYDFSTGCMRQHIVTKEQKTGKETKICIHPKVKASALKFLKMEGERVGKDTYIFRGRNIDAPLSRSQAWRIVKEAGNAVGIDGVISPHSLRKTFGYVAYTTGIQSSMLVYIFNHSSFEVTKRYLGLDQDEKDKVFMNIEI